ncbi:hypothetical protein R3W88_004467 [Solanum pinnatisectum]|uniref:Uncharacterized protein n=1 Tax=Solanum pinnatisectum TaxID=50273 RepID=A0AAV9KBG7_9SOLN|nr:hypothetical protein R3W88_004467 [Solanum pinnatisectum]
MSNFSKLEFVALDITGKYYLSWVLDTEIHLDAKGLGDTIKQENKASRIKIEYLIVKDPLELWINLKDRYDHLKLTVLPKARYEWIHLWFQDFKTVTEYNSTIHKVSSILKLCGDTITGDDLLEKTFSTFHASNVLLQQQYREKGYKKYSELITCLLVAEQNNTLLMKINEARPPGSAPFPEANVVATLNQSESRQNNYHVHDRGRDHGRGCRRGRAPSNKYDDIETNLAYKDDEFEGLPNITHLEAEDFYENID